MLQSVTIGYTWQKRQENSLHSCEVLANQFSSPKAQEVPEQQVVLQIQELLAGGSPALLFEVPLILRDLRPREGATEVCLPASGLCGTAVP